MESSRTRKIPAWMLAKSAQKLILDDEEVSQSTKRPRVSEGGRSSPFYLVSDVELLDVAREAIAKHDNEERALDAPISMELDNSSSSSNVFAGPRPSASPIRRAPVATAAATAPSSSQREDVRGPHFSLLTWNIDGLDPNELPARIDSVIGTIQEVDPDVVFLQEVVRPMYARLDSALSDNYLLIPGCENPEAGEYYVMMLLKYGSVVLNACKVTPFPGSQMGRALLRVETSIADTSVLLMTAHLESLKESSDERLKQLRFSLAEMLKADTAVVFGGDLNLRDSELKGAKNKLPTDVIDVWEADGRAKTTQFTWDTLKNDNKPMTGAAFKPRCRFDRIYARRAMPMASSFKLVGVKRVRADGPFPSDHFGIFTRLEVKQTKKK